MGPRPNPNVGLIFGLLLSLAGCCLAQVGPLGCKYVNSETLKCTLKTLAFGLNETESDVSKAKEIRIACVVSEESEVIVESILRTNHFGYWPHLRKLSIESCYVKKIPALAFSGLSGLHSLSFVNNGGTLLESIKSITEIQQDAFTGLNDLRHLNVSGNNLWSLPKGLFCSLSNLVDLDLSRNFLQDASDLAFASEDLQACRIPVRSLDLSQNSLSTLASTAFGQLEKLERLSLASNNLNVMDDQALGNLHSLLHLNMAHNRLVALPSDLLKETKYLQELDLHNNTLSVLAPGLLSDLQHLLVLNLSRNEITNDWLNPQTFESLVRLVALDLSHNRLIRLEGAVLNPLTSLQILDLSHNRIHSLNGNTFLSQVNLHSLKVSHNIIQEVNNDALLGLSVLSSLNFGFNRLERLSESLFDNCSSLVDLYLQGNMFRQVPQAIRRIKLLKTLDLGDNLLTNSLTVASLEGLHHLYGLRLAGNGLRTLNASMFEPVAKLQVLNLADNQLSKLDEGVFRQLPSLRMLRLDNNQLEELNGILAGQTQLRFLNVSQNRLQWFDYAFLPKSLEWLDLHSNDIEDLGNYYKLWSDFNLRYLDASQNLISSLGYLSLLPSLEVVELSENKISVVEASTFSNKSQLRRVNLRSNDVERLPLAALSLDLRPKSHRPEFLLSGNPLLCDCEMEWLQKINDMPNHGHHGLIADLDQVQCRLNSQYGLSAPVPIMQVHRSQFVCPYQAHCFALCMCCDFFACDCRMQCPEGCSCFHDSTWSANVIQCSRRGHRDIPALIPMDATSILLDGNNFTGLLESQAFIGRKRVLSLYLNGSQIDSVSSQTFNGLTELEVLHLEDNLIHSLQGYEFSNLTSLRELYLERNKLVFIDDLTFSALLSLEVLHLHDNLLNTYPVWQLGSVLLPSLSALTISGNPWTCQCKFVHKFLEFAKKSRPHLIADLVHVKCVADTNGGLVSLTGLSQLAIERGAAEEGGNNNVTCSDAQAVTYHTSSQIKHGFFLGAHVLPIAAAIISGCVILAVSSVLLFVFRTPLRVWLHSKYGVRLMNPTGKNEDKLYDAFVSYSVKDEDFVQQVLMSQLEHHDIGSYKLCLQHRDLPTSSSISDSFPGVSQLCAKHLLIVSRSYLETEWTQIKYALQDHKKLQPIMILLEELSSLDLAAAPEFNLLMKAGPILKWTDAGFWNKLRFYLPDAKRRTHLRPYDLQVGVEASSTKPPASSVAQRIEHTNWHYDGLLHNTSSNGSSSASTRSTTMHNQTQPHHQQQQPRHNYIENTYQSVANEHIYHTLEPQQSTLLDGTVYDSLCKLDVMLPNGQMVPATLVRNAQGKVIPLVEVNSQTLPHNNSSPVTSTAAATGSAFNSRILLQNSPGGNRHFV